MCVWNSLLLLIPSLCRCGARLHFAGYMINPFLLPIFPALHACFDFHISTRLCEREVMKPVQFIFKFKSAQNVKTTMEGQTIPNLLKVEVERINTLIIQHKPLTKALPSVSFKLWRMISGCVREVGQKSR